MAISTAQWCQERRPKGLELARVLLVVDEITSRLTLQTLLEAGGYSVDVASSAAEALAKLDEQQYELVLSDLIWDSPDAGRGVLSYARVKDYKPATALITSYGSSRSRRQPGKAEQQVSVDTRDVSTLLSKVADLIGMRATRRAVRALRASTT
jgi:CheY-like chemotaxis protein